MYMGKSCNSKMPLSRGTRGLHKRFAIEPAPVRVEQDGGDQSSRSR